jgi:hypothetical protein
MEMEDTVGVIYGYIRIVEVSTYSADDTNKRPL